MKNNKGFTVIELVVSVTIALLVMAVLFQIIFTLKDLYVSSGVRTELLNKQALMSQKINSTLLHKKISVATKCGVNCITFVYEDGTEDKLVIDPDANLFTFGNYSTKLVKGSHFENINIKTETTIGVDFGKKDSVISIKIPVKNKLFEEDFGINVLYQYDSRTSSISDITINDKPVANTIYLKGSATMVMLGSTTYTEPGFYIYDVNGVKKENPSNVTVSGTVGTTPGTTYTLTYQLKNGETVVATTTRKVTVVKDLYQYDYTGNYATFTAPSNGIYQIELWGAGAPLTNGGAYTTGRISLKKDETFYVYVGQAGYTVSDATTWNGGASSGGGWPGGGATDIRLESGVWNDFNSLRTRIMVAGAAGAYNHTSPGNFGYGGTLVGGNGENKSNPDNYLGLPGTQIGSPTSYYSQSGFGFGGGGCGGGSGYYGGSGAACVNGGGGGSSYISGYNGCDAIAKVSTASNIVHTGQSVHYSGKSFTSTNMIAGNAIMPNPRGTGNITGNLGNGYARIKLVSITQS